MNKQTASKIFTHIIIGLASLLVTLGVAELVAGILLVESPIISVGQRIVDLAPPFLKEFAIDTFGTKDKPVLIGTVGFLLFVFTVIVASRLPKLKQVFSGVALLALVGAIAAGGFKESLPVLFGALAASGFFWLVKYMMDNKEPETIHVMPRRRFLAQVAGIGAGGVALYAIGGEVRDRVNIDEVRNNLALPEPSNNLGQVPNAQSPVEGVSSFFTPNKDFYRIDTNLTIPQLSPDSWSLKVKGMVDNEIELTYQDLLDLEFKEYDVTLTCVSNEVGGTLLGTARWLGTPLSGVLAMAGIKPEVDQIAGRAFDGWTSGFPVETLQQEGVSEPFIAIAMNGEPLPAKHGFPARLIVPGLYGYVSATKWLTEIELTTFDAFDSYWVPRGYAAKAPIKMQSRIDAPKPLANLQAGKIMLGGVAWNQNDGISKVEINTGSGWSEAILHEEVNGSTWRQWTYEWDATPGFQTVQVRAYDKAGEVQTEEKQAPLPDGATGWHQVVYNVS